MRQLLPLGVRVEYVAFVVQATRERSRQRATGAARAKPTSPLRGLITDELGRSYEPVHTTKAGKRYRYYVSKKETGPGPDRKQGRLPADLLEQNVADRWRRYLASRDELLDTLFAEQDDVDTRERVLRAAELATTRPDADWVHWRPLIRQIVVRPTAVDLILDRNAARQFLGASAEDETRTVTLSIPVRLYRTGHDLRLVINNGPGADEAGVTDKALIRLIARGRRWYEQLTSGELSSVRDIAKAEELDERYVARILYSALLAPDIIEKTLQGRQPIRFTVKSLKRLPSLDWDEQRRAYGMSR